MAGAPGHARLVCLLPARNAEPDLDGWFESVRRFADAVVALDDGSTDRTPELLEAEPLVQVLLRNPRRPSHLGWNDSANRNRLLEAAASLEPDWIISLDADERLAPDDAAALRALVDGEADPTYAYSFPVYRMIGDVEHYDRIELHALRLFAFEPGQHFPDDRFHFRAVPTSFPRERWRLSTVRIQHLAALDSQRRRARWSKYREVDPDNEWEADYAYALRPPGRLSSWTRRAPGEPLVLEDQQALTIATLDLEGPILSVAVVADAVTEPGADALRALVEALRDDVDGVEDVEAFVLDCGGGRATRSLAAVPHAPPVIELDEGTASAAAANIGLKVAGGDYVLYLAPGDRVMPGCVAEVMRLHEQGHALVAARAPSWPMPQSSACSFAKDIVLAVGGFPEAVDPNAAWLVTQLLARWDFKVAFTDRVVPRQRPAEAPGALRLVRDRFQLGRALGRAAGVEPLLPWQPAPGWSVARYLAEGLAAISRWRVPVTARVSAVAGHVATWAGLCWERPMRRRSGP
jgi:hypothetical protein